MSYAAPVTLVAANDTDASHSQARVRPGIGSEIWPEVWPRVQPRLWIVSVTAFEAAVFSQSRSDAANDAANDSCLWRLDPEAGMRLNVEPDSRLSAQVIEQHLARLIASMLTAARAGDRFDHLVVLANPPACDSLRRHLNATTRASILRELAAPAGSGVTEIIASLRRACPDLFG
ncbi:MAG TPA: host attachment protein [Asticcacaulis sp.]|nr:host attachment protein [Asticcacaulis sp.]